MKKDIEKGEQTMISVTQLAERWDCSSHHIWNQIKDGKIPANKLGGKWFIQKSFVDEFEGGKHG